MIKTIVMLVDFGNPSANTTDAVPPPGGPCLLDPLDQELPQVVEDLHPREDGEPSEESQGASHRGDHTLHSHLGILHYLVIGWGGEVDVHQVQVGALCKL